MNSPRNENIDAELNKTISNIYDATNYLRDKHLKIRVYQWLDKIKTPTQNIIWKQNSLLYARVLLEMVKQHNLEKPFRGIPPDGPLPRLDKFEIVFILFLSIFFQKQPQPQLIWQKLLKQKPQRQPLTLVNRQFTPKLKTEPITFSYSTVKHSQWDQIRESIEGANKNMQEFKKYLDHVLR